MFGFRFGCGFGFGFGLLDLGLNLVWGCVRTETIIKNVCPVARDDAFSGEGTNYHLPRTRVHVTGSRNSIRMVLAGARSERGRFKERARKVRMGRAKRAPMNAKP